MAITAYRVTQNYLQQRQNISNGLIARNLLELERSKVIYLNNCSKSLEEQKKQH